MSEGPYSHGEESGLREDKRFKKKKNACKKGEGPYVPTMG